MDLAIEEEKLKELTDKKQLIEEELCKIKEEISRKMIEIEVYKSGVKIGSKLIHRRDRVRVVDIITRNGFVIAKCAVMKKDGTYGMRLVDVYIKYDDITFDQGEQTWI